MGHIRVHETANTLSHPNKCHDCGYNGEDRLFYVDTGINTEWDGFIVICSSCMLNLVVKTYGFNPFDMIKVMELDKELLARNTANEMKLLNQLRQGLNQLGLAPQSLIALAGFIDEEENGLRTVTDTIVDNQSTVRVDSKPDDNVIAGLSLS